MTVTFWLKANAVARVKPMVMVWAVALGTREKAPVKDTSVTVLPQTWAVAVCDSRAQRTMSSSLLAIFCQNSSTLWS